MKALLQRVSRAEVSVAGERIAAIRRGLLVFVAIEPDDGEAEFRWVVDRVLELRVFPDERLPMNLSVRDVDGEVLVVPQFTLAADTARGRRPGFSGAAPPAQAQAGYERVLALFAERWPKIGAGHFGADMAVSLVNDGPATFILER